MELCLLFLEFSKNGVSDSRRSYYSCSGISLFVQILKMFYSPPSGFHEDDARVIIPETWGTVKRNSDLQSLHSLPKIARKCASKIGISEEITDYFLSEGREECQDIYAWRIWTKKDGI